jgi:hypothetical protein
VARKVSPLPFDLSMNARLLSPGYAVVSACIVRPVCSDCFRCLRLTPLNYRFRSMALLHLSQILHSYSTFIPIYLYGIASGSPEHSLWYLAELDSINGRPCDEKWVRNRRCCSSRNGRSPKMGSRGRIPCSLSIRSPCRRASRHPDIARRRRQ